MRKQFYSEISIFCGALLGGPLASIYMLQKNYRVFGMLREAYLTLVIGLLLLGGAIGYAYSKGFSISEYEGYAITIVQVILPLFAHTMLQRPVIANSPVDGREPVGMGKTIVVILIALALSLTLAIIGLMNTESGRAAFSQYKVNSCLQQTQDMPLNNDADLIERYKFLGNCLATATSAEAMHLRDCAKLAVTRYRYDANTNKITNHDEVDKLIASCLREKR